MKIVIAHRRNDAAQAMSLSVYRRDVAQPEQHEIENRVNEREDLVERIDRGDSAALGELLEHATGAKVRS